MRSRKKKPRAAAPAQKSKSCLAGAAGVLADLIAVVQFSVSPFAKNRFFAFKSPPWAGGARMQRSGGRAPASIRAMSIAHTFILGGSEPRPSAILISIFPGELSARGPSPSLSAITRSPRDQLERACRVAGSPTSQRRGRSSFSKKAPRNVDREKGEAGETGDERRGRGRIPPHPLSSNILRVSQFYISRTLLFGV